MFTMQPTVRSSASDDRLRNGTPMHDVAAAVNSAQVLAEGGSGEREHRASGVSNTLGRFRIHPQGVLPPTSTTHRSAAGEQRGLNVAVFLNEVLAIGRPLRRGAVFALCAYEVQIARHLDVVGTAGVDAPDTYSSNSWPIARLTPHPSPTA